MADQPAIGLPLRPDRKDRHIFCDESGLSDRYFILGSLHCSSHTDDFRSDLDGIKRKHSLNSEIKWEKFPKKSGQYLNGYTAIIEKFLESPLTYKALIVDTQTHPLNHRQFTGGERGIGYYQFYLTLLFNGIIRYEPIHNTRVYLHTPAYTLDGGLGLLEEKVNERALHYGFPEMPGHSCCRISSSSSKTDAIIQLTDILTGMIGAVWNEKMAGRTKQELVARCSNSLKIDIAKPSESRHVDHKLNRWLFRPNIDVAESKKWPALYPPTK